METVFKIMTSVLLVLNTFATVNGKIEHKEKDHLPIQIFFNPIKEIEKLVKLPSDDSLVKSENQEIQLKIRSDDDLIIAATKEVQAIEEKIDRYSPTYNAEREIAKNDSYINSKSDNYDIKAFETARQYPSTLYQPSEFTGSVPFTSMNQILEQPRNFLFGRNAFSPSQNLRNLEENLQREVHPRTLGQTINTDLHLNNEVPFGMIMTQPTYSNGYVPVYDINSRFHTDPHSLTGVPYAQNPQNYYDIGAPQQVQIIKNTPTHNPLIIDVPQRNSLVNQQNPYYEYIKPLPNPAYQDPQHQYDIRELSRDPRYNSQSNVKTPQLEQHVLLQVTGQPHYNSQGTPQNSLSAMYNKHAPSRSNLNNYHQRIPNDLHHPHTGNRQLVNEEYDRNIHYTPITDKHEKYEQKNPTYTSEEIRRPIHDRHLHRMQIIPHGDHRGINTIRTDTNHPLPNRLQTRTPASSSRGQQIPHYTLVPQNLLPKYLQNGIQNSQVHPTLPGGVKPQHEHHSLNSERPRDLQGYPNPSYQSEGIRIDSSQEPHLSEVHRRYPHQKDYPIPSHQVHSRDPQKSYSVPSHHLQSHEHQEGYSVPSRHVESHGHQKDYSIPSRHVQSREHQKGNSVPSRHVQSRDPSQQEDEYRTKIQDSQLVVVPKRRRKYKLNEVVPEHENLPRKKELSRSRKINLKDNVEDLDGHSSHQYIIKIG